MLSNLKTTLLSITALALTFYNLPAAAAVPVATALPAQQAAITATGLKFFHLAHKDVVALAVETRLPATSVADPLTYKLEPKYSVSRIPGQINILVNALPTLPELNCNNSFSTKLAAPWLKEVQLATPDTGQLKFTANYSKTATPQITTVQRKRVIQADNTIIFRTYLVLSFINAAETPPRTIVLDPGHGGPALGTTANNLYEKDLNLDIALLACDIFRDKGYDTYMTRTDDTGISLLDRADAANILDAAVLISIHNNAMPDDMPDAAKRLYRGTTVLYNSAALRPAKELATIMGNEIAAALRIHQYPLQDRPGLVVLNSSWVPAVIAEVSMLPHPQDAKLISQRINRLAAAEAIVTATEKYFATNSLTAGR